MFTKKKIASYCDKLLYWIVIFIPFSVAIGSGIANSLIVFAILGYFLKKIISKNHLPQKTVISLPFFSLIIISLISMRNTIDLGSSFIGLEKLLKYGFTFLIFYEVVKDTRHLERIVFSLCCGLLLVSLDGVFQLQFGRDFIRNQNYNFVIGIPRLRASFPHTNLFGLYLGLVIPLVFSLGRYFLKNWKRGFFIITSILGFFCLIFTFSRGAVIGLLFATTFIAIFKKDKLLISFILIFVLIAPFLLPGSVKDWVKQRSSIWELMLNAERIYIYQTAVNMIKSHPFIGVGVNTFCANYLNYKVNQSYGNTGGGSYYGHNNFLHMAGEIGLIGLGIFLWLLFILFKKWYIIYKSLPSGSLLKIISLGLIADIFGFLINGLTETGLYYSKIATIFWVQIGILLAVFKISQNNIKQE